MFTRHAEPRKYAAHETERMQELDGAELAPFWRRAVALTVDFLLAGILFLLLAIAIISVQAAWKQAPNDAGKGGPGAGAQAVQPEVAKKPEVSKKKEQAHAYFHAEALSLEQILHHGAEAKTEQGKHDISLGFFDSWHSVLYLALFFGLSNYWGNGRTLGKRLMGIRAVSLVHHRLSLWHSFERALGYGASTLELGFGFLQYYIHPNRRTVHDRIAETIVVRERRD